MAIDKTVDLCRKNTKSSEVKAVLSATAFSNATLVIAKMVTQIDAVRQEKLISNGTKDKTENKGNYRSNLKADVDVVAVITTTIKAIITIITTMEVKMEMAVAAIIIMATAVEVEAAEVITTFAVDFILNHSMVTTTNKFSCFRETGKCPYLKGHTKANKLPNVCNQFEIYL